MDYRDTVFLPRTDFPMRAGLPQREPQTLERWQKADLHGQIRAARAGKPTFILHDGPPYANGNLHIGHALNKILKDVIVRSWTMLGYDAPYVPGWDCHGLPIEWKIEEAYRAKKQDKDSVDPVAFRAECRAFAAKWLDIQREEFKRLGVMGSWDNPYSTMDFASEARIVEELTAFLMDGSLYRGAKPVMWSVVEKTALADAEIEYHDHTSTTIWVRFPVVRASDPVLKDASAVIWTTTPWTIPGNRAMAYGADITYAVVRVDAVAEGSLAKLGERLILAEALVAATCETAGITAHTVEATLPGHALAGTVCRHPWHGRGYDFEVPLLAGDFVTTEQGTGLVHIAPGHGEDDWRVGKAHGIAVPDTVGPAGLYLDHVPLVAGQHVYKVAPVILDLLRRFEGLLAHGTLVHSYPHSWRSKAPLIFRNTPQWFIAMDRNGLRQKALEAIDAVQWVPAQAKNRIRSMVEDRPDWCVSRQRAWGVPITVFVDKASGEPLRDPEVNGRIIEAVKAVGADAWFTTPASVFLGPDRDPGAYERVTDILDVWFDSGSTHAFVLDDPDDQSWPADLYLEGSDQHRGWFQSSLLEACGTRGRAPYKAVLTHGFVMDEQGRKMSKSLGNVTAPQDVVDQSGADILRLWVMASDYSEDLRIGPEIVKQTADTYRRIRNTWRFLLGALAGFSEAERVTEPAAMPELERWVLHRLAGLDAMIRKAIASHDYLGLMNALHAFCAVDLSAFYFDVRKDALYCDAPDDPTRCAARTVMDHVFRCLTTWMAPVLPFTAEEAWLSRFGDDATSVHLETFPAVPETWRDEALATRWVQIRKVRRVVTGALEQARAAKTIGASLQAAPILMADAETLHVLKDLDMAELCITSGLILREGAAPADAFVLDDVPGVGVVMALADGSKCARCWKVLPDVGTHGHGTLCRRCDHVVTDQLRGAA